MKYIKWAAMVPVMLLVTLATVILAPVLALCVEKRVGVIDNGTNIGEAYYLFTWLSWFQTPDNSIDGDQGWRTEHWQWRFKLPLPLAVYVGRVGWLWRNPGYGFGLIRVINYGQVTITGTYGIETNPLVEGSLLIEDPSYFQYRLVKRISAGKALYMNLGWNIKGIYEAPIGTSQICTFAFSPRIVSIGE
jgi:hypothetical protein